MEWTQARPVLIMLLCTCIAFSATASYIPPAALAAAETEPDVNGSAGNASGDRGRRDRGNGNDCKDRRRDRGKRI